MRREWTRRLVSVFLVSLPLGFWFASNARRTLDAIQTDPAGYLAHKAALQNPSLGKSYATSLVLVVVIVVLVEGFTGLLGRLWGSERPAA